MIKKLFILSLFLLTSISLCLASEQIIFGGSDSSLGKLYIPLMGTEDAGWEDTEDWAEQVIPTDGTISDLYVLLTDAPGSGNSRSFTLRKNGADTSLVTTVSDTNTTGSDTADSFTVTAGNTITLKHSSSGTPASSVASWCIKFTPDISGETILLGSSGKSNLTADYQVLHGVTSPDSTELDVETLIPTPGTIKKLYAEVKTAPSAGESWTFTVRKNSSNTTLVTTISNTNTTSNDSANSFTVNAGDSIVVKISSSATPTASVGNVSVVFVPDMVGEFIIAMSTDDIPLADSTEYSWISAGDVRWGTEVKKDIVGQSCTIKKMYVELSTAPGAGKSVKLTLRENGADTSPELSVTISDTNKTGNSSQDVTVDNSFDSYTLSHIPTGTPSTGSLRVSMLGFIPLPTKIQGATLQGVTIN